MNILDKGENMKFKCDVCAFKCILEADVQSDERPNQCIVNDGTGNHDDAVWEEIGE